MRKWIVQALTPILSGLALVLAVIGLGRAARASLHDRATYSVAFTDIDCRPPEGLSRSEFLREVQADTRQPSALHVLDEDLLARLHRAFAVHPWVDSIRRVTISSGLAADGQRKPSIRLELTYRRPVLAVCLPDDKLPLDGAASVNIWSGSSRSSRLSARAVDRQGILLPVSAVQGHLPVLITPVSAPSGPTGSRWGDARVAAAARTTALLEPHLTRLRLDDSEVEILNGEIVYHRPGVRIVWGHAPGHEEDGEASAKVKLQRLLDYQQEHDGLDSLEHDVRLLAYQGHFPLSAEEPIRAVSLYESSQVSSSRNCDHVSNSVRTWRSCFNDAKAPSASASSR